MQVEISGKAKLLSLAGEAVHSSAGRTGSFVSSSVLLNRIHKLILMAIENNMESILTDCPHREKLGWLEQTHLMGSALNYDFDLDRLYQKIETDMADAQKADGMVPTTAPQYTTFSSMGGIFNDSPEWGSAAVLDPWLAYRRYGDLSALRRAYPVMRRYVDYLTSRSRNGIVDYGLGDWYDIGPKPSGFAQLTSRALTATGVYYEDILALQSTARVLGDTEEGTRMAALRRKVADAFQHRFYHPETHEYDRGNQASNATALALGLVPPEHRAAVLENLIADIRAHQNHVTAGEVGFHYLVHALQDNGASDVLLDMLLRTDAPSYGYQLKQGATALTESWNANPHHSQDHFMLGEGEEWFYAGLAGIHIDFSLDGMEQIVIHPTMLPLLRSADVDYRFAKGNIHVAWKHGLRETAFDLTIPPNAVATVIFPPGAESDIREEGRPAARARGITFTKMDGKSPEFMVESGEYHFIIPVSQSGSM